MGRVGGLVDGRVDEVALGGIVLAAGDQFELLVGLGLINSTGQLLERGGVDDGTAEVGMVPWLADANLVDFSSQLLLELGPNRLGDVDARSGTALLALELESTTDGMLSGVVQVR